MFQDQPIHVSGSTNPCFDSDDILPNLIFVSHKRENLEKEKPTVTNLKEFSTIRILREISFGHFEALKITLLTILAALNF